MTWAYGKAILLGEHAVVHGHPALAGAVDCPLRCRLQRPGDGVPAEAAAAAAESSGGAGIRLLVPAWGVDVTVAVDAPPGRPAEPGPAAALEALLRCLGAHLGVDVAPTLGPCTLIVDTRLPAAAGLGSSAALSVALVRTLAGGLQRDLQPDEIESVADSAERCFHENPSGVDVALATRGGLGLFRRGQGLTPVDAPPLTLAVGLSGQPRSTAAMVARVAAARQADTAAVDARLAALGAAAVDGAAAMVAGDVARLGALMDAAHAHLAAVGVSSPALDTLVAVARGAGALGAKLTGAGGGGAVIALGGGREHDIVAAWQRAGYEGFVCRVGVRAPDMIRQSFR